jgi:stress response protein YsnF
MTVMPDEHTETVIPLAEDVLRVSKRLVETGKVRISLTTETVEETVRETLRTRHAEVERVPIDREVSEVPQARQEGDVMIVPVVEEILVIERRLLLKEEIHLRLVDGEQTLEQSVMRRVQRAMVEHLPVGPAAPPSVQPVHQSTQEQEP